MKLLYYIIFIASSINVFWFAYNIGFDRGQATGLAEGRINACGYKMTHIVKPTWMR